MNERVDVTASMIVIGNEVLSGRTQDKNLNYVARGLSELGVQLREARIVPDDPEMIVDAVNELRARYDYVFTSGGIGPTHDDITADCVAKAFGVGIDYHPEAVAILKAHMGPGMLNEARMRMARIPDGAELVENPVSKAPGFRIENVYVFAGIPAIMQAMFEGIRHELTGGEPLLSRTVSSYLPEGAIARPLGALQEEFSDLELGSYPFYRQKRFGTSVVIRGRDVDRLDAAAARYREIVKTLGEDPVDGDAV